ncbi:formimidoylglutamate deiminase [Luethyella okanaganae]|uniref:Formimidoylglutamate deiminase n=1 Tax=Luethyella okanaganae TaxID=69372 RepID=A0ABW1VE35_9MICO
MTTITTPASANAHSHAFHRMLRGRTHGAGGSFWTWRDLMYRVAAALDPDLYRELAEAVFAEMLVSGYTAVGEFHYVHHRPDGSPYEDPNAMGRALAEAAESVGIRLTLLDTCYLASAPGVALLPEQARFGDGTVTAWQERWQALAPLASGLVTIGAAIHSVRAVSPHDIAAVAEALPEGVPLHIHLSEQPAENEQSLAAFGRTPTGVLATAGALSPRLSVVHATHLTSDDIALLGAAEVTVVMCPTTEADLGDGIGPARELVDAGATIAIGSDQHVVIDPYLEVRGLEAGERMRSLARGRFSPAELDAARSSGGFRSVGVVEHEGDTVVLDVASVRTAGAAPDQLASAATASDVIEVSVGGRVVARRGVLADGRDPAAMLSTAIAQLSSRLEGATR